MVERFDLAVIGSGPGGYVAAIRAAQLKMRVALIERDRLGGVCLNVGCIPTKALLRNAEVISLFQRATEFGVSFEKMSVDFAPAVKRSQQAAERLSKGVALLMKKHQVTVLKGEGHLVGGHRVRVRGGGGTHEIQGERILIATGSRPRPLPDLPMDGTRVISSTEALALPTVPRRLLIIGAGAVGVEFADIYQAYGSEVTLIEMLPRILPVEDADCSNAIARSFRKRGIHIHTGAKVEAARVRQDGVTARVSVEGSTEEFKGDAVLVAVGRAPNSDELGLETLGVERDRGGFIRVDERYETTIPGIFAIGDVIGAPLLAHKAMAEAVVAVEGMAGGATHRVDPLRVPSCTYCHPQVASVGLTEAQAREGGRRVKIGRFPYRASGKAVCLGETDGFVKVVADEAYGEILGVHILGPEATELIAEATLGLTLESTVEEIHASIHAHPTLSEAMGEACLDALGRAIHA